MKPSVLAASLGKRLITRTSRIQRAGIEPKFSRDYRAIAQLTEPKFRVSRTSRSFNLFCCFCSSAPFPTICCPSPLACCGGGAPLCGRGRNKEEGGGGIDIRSASERSEHRDTPAKQFLLKKTSHGQQGVLGVYCLMLRSVVFLGVTLAAKIALVVCLMYGNDAVLFLGRASCAYALAQPAETETTLLCQSWFAGFQCSAAFFNLFPCGFLFFCLSFVFFVA